MCDIAVEGNCCFSDPMDLESLKDPLIKNQENSENDGVNSELSRNDEENGKNNGGSSGDKRVVRKNSGGRSSGDNGVVRRERPSRACTQRAAQRVQEAAEAEAKMVAAQNKRRVAKRRERLARQLGDVGVDEEGDEEDGVDDVGKSALSGGQCSKIVTPLVGEPESSQLQRWNIRAMWELASILNFLHVFRPLLKIQAEFSAEEFETALISPNSTLGEIHMPLLKAIPPITRMALGHNTWITVLCRKLRDWWHWVAEGELPIVAAQGAEIEAYHALDPGVRVVILKALCDIRVEQEDIQSYIDNSIKQGFHPSTFRKERLGGNSHGISYWYEDDPIVGHRLYRLQRNVEVKRGKGRNIPPIPNSSYQWETVATNLDEFLDVSEKLISSTNRTEVSVGKKLKNDMLAEIEKVHKRKEKLLKKQHRQALLLDNMLQMDALAAGRSLRDRKQVTYTFDDYDRSINEAIEETKKKPPSSDLTGQGDLTSHEVATNGTSPGPSQFSRQSSFGKQFSKSSTDDEHGYDSKDATIDHGNRRRTRPQRYSVKDFVEAVSDNDSDYDNDSAEDIDGEAVYDDEYIKQRKRKKSSSSEEDEEYHWDDENPEDEEEEEEANSYSPSDESDQPQPRKLMKLQGRTRRETKQRSVHEIRSGLRRSNRATRNRMDYSYYDASDSENELMKSVKSNGSHEQSDASDNDDLSSHSEDSDQNLDNQNIRVDQTMEEHSNLPQEEYSNLPEEEELDQHEGQVQDNQDHPSEKLCSPDHNEVEGVEERQFLDLNELAPGSGYDEGPNSTKGEGTDDL